MREKERFFRVFFSIAAQLDSFVFHFHSFHFNHVPLSKFSLFRRPLPSYFVSSRFLRFCHTSPRRTRICRLVERHTYRFANRGKVRLCALNYVRLRRLYYTRSAYRTVQIVERRRMWTVATCSSLIIL